jgi:ornithine carbamoyltransferase
MQLPAQPSYVQGKLAGLVFRDTSERTRSAIASYVTSQLTAT